MSVFSLLSAFNLAEVRVAAAAPHAERVLRLARPTDPKTLDLAEVYLSADFVLLGLLNCPLLDMRGTELTNGVARGWSVSADARVFTFHLRPGRKFSNGRPVVTADYAYALERILDPQTASPMAVYMAGVSGATAFKEARKKEQDERRQEKTGGRPRLGRWIEPIHVPGIRASSPDTLVIELNEPDPVFPYFLPGFGMAQPQEEVERPGAPFNVRGAGDGAYMVEEWIRGTRLIFKPNPHYVGLEPRHFDRIEILIGGDASTHLMMFERGELDIADIEWFMLPVADHLRITRDPRWRFQIEEALGFWPVYISLNTEIPPLDHPKVRQALNYAVNKPRCLLSASGRWEVATGILPPSIPGYNPGLKGYPHDPARARALLAESGVAQPIRLTLWHSQQLELRMLAQRIQADLRDIGVEAELKEVTFTELGAALPIPKKVPMAIWGYISSVPDPKDLLGSLFDGRTITNGWGMNSAFYSNPEVNRLLDEAGTNVTMTTRYALYQQAEEIVVRDAPFIFLGYPKFFALKQPWIKGRLIEPLWPFRLDRVWGEE